MKKFLVISIFILLPLIAFAQKIDYSTIDAFTGKTVICTKWVPFRAKYTPSTSKYSDRYLKSEFMLRYEEGKIFFHLKWMDGVKRIKEGEELQLKLKDGAVLTLYAIDDFIADTDVNTSNSSNSRNILHAVYYSDLVDLSSSQNPPIMLRISTTYGASVLKIDDENARKLLKAYMLISDEVKKIGE